MPEESGIISQADWDSADDFPPVEGGDVGEAEIQAEGQVETSDEGQDESTEISAYLRDLSEDDVYNTLVQSRNLPDKITAAHDRMMGKAGELEAKLKKLEEAYSQVNTQAVFDPEPIRKVLEAYDPGLAKSGLAEALAEAIKVTPLSEDVLSPYFDKQLGPIKEQVGDTPFGAQLVLSHYSKDDLNSIVPPADEAGNLAPQSQRHKDFISWYQLQPHQTHVALERFGPEYVHALRQFEKWESAQKQDKSKSSGKRTQRLAGGAMPPASRKNGSTVTTPRNAEEAFQYYWEHDE